MISTKAKGILSIIGGFLLHLGMGSVYSFGLLNPFFISYLYEYDHSLVPDDGFFIMPMGILFLNLFTSVGGLIESKVGPKMYVLISI